MGAIIAKNVCQKVEPFLILCALMGTHVDTGAIIIRHLVEVGKTTHENVIGVEHTITTITQALGHGREFDTLEPYFLI